MDDARTEMNNLVAESGLKLALKANSPGAASWFEDAKVGLKVLVYGENQINEWIAPSPF